MLLYKVPKLNKLTWYKFITHLYNYVDVHLKIYRSTSARTNKQTKMHFVCRFSGHKLFLFLFPFLFFFFFSHRDYHTRLLFSPFGLVSILLLCINCSFLFMGAFKPGNSHIFQGKNAYFKGGTYFWNIPMRGIKPIKVTCFLFDV